jgi:flavin-dependent dehydrogenase
VAQDGDHGEQEGAGRTYPAELVVDACGRRSPARRWVVGAGCRPPVTDHHPTGIAYLCRWYRLTAEAPRPGALKTGSTADFAFGGVFPSDNGTFAVSLVVSTGDPTRGPLMDPDVFEAVARRFPAIAGWLDLGAVPETGVLAMGGLDNRWTSYADEAGPVVTGFVNAGDSLVHTNPTLGQGVALGLKAAQWLAGHVAEVAADPAGYHAWTREALRPWFDRQVAGDGASERLLAAAEPPSDARSAALAELAFEDPVVMRARAQVRHQVRTRDEAYGTEEVRERVDAWLAARPGFTPRNDGPTRAEWEALIPA